MLTQCSKKGSSNQGGSSWGPSVLAGYFCQVRLDREDAVRGESRVFPDQVFEARITNK